MPRYIDADNLLEQLSKKQAEPAKYRYTEGFNEAIMRVRSMVSSSAIADVVPKSEVDKWKDINEQLHKEMSERMVEERKIERKLVAREIFEEIEKYLSNENNEAEDFHQRQMIKGKRDRFYAGANFYLAAAVKFVAELKKKYTEKDEGDAK